MAGNSKNFLKIYPIISAGDMTGDLTSLVTAVSTLDNVGLQFVWTGTPTGTFFVDVSLDHINWTPITFSSPPVAAGSAGNVFIDLNQTAAGYVRARYVHTSSTGTLTANISAKAV